jgi:signal transduction histidine kinase
VTLRQVLVTPTVVLALVAGAVLSVVAWNSLVATRHVEREVADVRRANALAHRIAQLSVEKERAVLTYARHPSPALRERIGASAREISALAAELERIDLSPRGRALWEQVVAARRVRDAERDALLDAVDRGAEALVDRAHARWDLAVERSSALVSDLAVFNLRRLERSASRLETLRRRSTLFLFSVLLAGALFVLGFSLLVERRVVRPIRAMTAAARRIATERVELEVPGADRDDELGVLATAMTGMASDLVRANADLARSVAARDEFLSVASHELKTPLTSLKLHLQNARRRWPAGAPEPVPPWVAAALRQIDRLEALIADLLDLARIRAGRFQLRPAPVDVSELVRGAAERLKDVLARAGNSLELDVAAGISGVYDGGRIEQVVSNLLANAAHHAAGAPVRLRLARAEGRVVIAVEDGGAGVPEHARERIFAPYEKVDGRGATAPLGLGLGLYIARQIADAHGGAIAVSRSELGGAAFVMTLPLAPPEAAPPPSGAC